MRLCCVLLMCVALRGGGCIQFLLQRPDALCVYNVMVEGSGPAQGRNLCANMNNQEILDYDLTEGFIYLINVASSPLMLERLSFNLKWDKQMMYQNVTGVQTVFLRVDWKNKMHYVLTDTHDVMVASSDPMAERYMYCVARHADLADAAGVDVRGVKVWDLHVDPYAKVLFFYLNRLTSGNVFILSSDLQGKGLKTILKLDPSTTREFERKYNFCIDIGDKKIYLSDSTRLYQYNYEGTLLREFQVPFLISKHHVLGNSLYLIDENSIHERIYELFLNQTESPLRVKNIYEMNTTGIVYDLINFDHMKLIDARVQRPKRDGKYVCDHNCTELCEVLPSGDTCLCTNSKAKAQDGVTCYKCGRSKLTSAKVQPTIVGGNYSQPGDFPWHATLYNTTFNPPEQFCGGTLISSRAVLTAAHCVTVKCNTCIPANIDTKNVLVTFGGSHRAWTAEAPVWQVSRIEVNDKYVGSPRSFAHDIALLILATAVPMSNLVMPACLDFNLNQLPRHETLDGYVPGFGYTTECGKRCSNYSDSLQHTKVHVMTFNDCFVAVNRLHPSIYHRLTSDKFCAGNGSVSAVQPGDSGGGLTLVHEGLHYVSGVVSVKIMKNAARRHPNYSFAGFTNVSEHMDWLKQVLPSED